MEFSKIDLLKCHPQKDFCIGFYTTISKQQAEKFAKIKSTRYQKNCGFVGIFEFLGNTDLNIKKFADADIEWLDFILSNRGFSNQKLNHEYDIIIGAVADDAVGLVLNQLIIGTYGEPNSTEAKETAIRLLDAQKLYNQVLFRTEKAISSLKFKETYRVKVDQ